MHQEFQEFESVTHCDICDSKDLASLYKPSDVQECRNCHFVFASPRPTFREIEKSYSGADFYDGWISESQGRAKLWKKRFRKIQSLARPGLKILDYSAGIGTFLSHAQKYGLEVYGTEISSSAKRIAKETYHIDLQAEDQLLAPAKTEFYDIITAWHVVEHVESPSQLLQRFYQSLKPGGALVVAVPNNQSRSLKQVLLGRQNPLKNLYPVLHPGGEIHLSHFSETTLTAILHKCGFKVQSMGIDDHFANPNLKTDLKYAFYTGLRMISGLNFSETIFVVATK